MELTEKEKELAKRIVAEAEKDLKSCVVDYEKYLKPQEPQTMNKLMWEMLFHAQNGNGKRGIKLKERKEVFRKILYDFSPKEICKNYKNSDEIWVKLPNDWKINDKGERSDWKLYSKTIFESACLFKNFNTVEEVKNTFVTIQEKFGKYYLPQLLMKIPGIKLAFSCDFLKEIGYEKYAKPDTHITDIMRVLFFNGNYKISDEEILKKIDDICEELKITQYCFDKLLYLVCTHDFYLDKENVKKYNNKLSQTKRKEFIEKIKNK